MRLNERDDHDTLMDLRPRVDHLERRADRLDQRQDQFDTAMKELAKALADTERRLQGNFEGGIRTLRDEMRHHLASISDHLTSQDEHQAQFRERVVKVQEEIKVELAAAQSRWPAGAVVFVTVAATAIVTLLAAWLGHLRI